MKLPILLSLIAIALAEQPLECSLKGPKYWCSDRETATKCHAVAYCEKYSWTNTVTENMDTCTTCQEFVGTLHMMLSNKQTQSQVVLALQASCKLLPAQLAVLCEGFVGMESNKIIAFALDHTKDPRQLCTAMDLCSADSRVVEAINFVATKKMLEEKVFADYCEPCKKYAASLHTRMSAAKTKSEIVVSLKGFCKLAPPSFSTLCGVLVNDVGEQFVDWVHNSTKDASGFCIATGMCLRRSGVEHQATEPIKFTPRTYQFANDRTCELCQQGIGTLRLMLSNKETQKEVIAEMDSACTALPSSYQSYCHSLVESYATTIIDEILKYTQDPRPLCQMLHLCNGKAPLRKLVGKTPASKCGLCKYTAEAMGGILNNDDVQKQAMILVLDICRHMPSSYEAICTSTVESSFIPAVKFIIEKLLHPSDLCQEIRMCTSTGVAQYKPLRGVECSVCKYGAEGLALVLGKKQTQDEVKEAVEAFCSQLPPSFRGTCSAMIEENFDAALKFFLEKLENPEDLCEEIGMCSATGKLVRKVKKVSGVGCDVCMYTAEGVGGILQNKQSQEEVKEAVLGLCAQFPGTYRATCTAMISENFDMAMKFFIEKLENPMDICKEFGMCSVSVRLLKKEDFPKANGVTCEVCELLIQKLDSVLEGNTTVEAIKNALNKICDQLYWSQQCTILVDEYADKIAELLASELDPVQVCTNLGLCGSKKLISRVMTKPKVFKMRARQTDFSRMQARLLDEELPTCNLCSFMSGKLDALLTKPKGRRMIKNVLKTICSRPKLSSEQREECQRLMVENKDMIVKLANNFRLPSLCKEVGHCIVGHNGAGPIAPLGSDMKTAGKGCIICEYLIGVLDTFLMKKSTKTEIINGVHNLCNQLPRDIFKTECNALVTQYGEEIIQLFADSVLAPVDICSHFGVC